MIIDRTISEFDDVPETLNGEVLLERNNGFLTASIELVRSLKEKTDAELEEIGWLKYKDIIQAV